MDKKTAYKTMEDILAKAKAEGRGTLNEVERHAFDQAERAYNMPGVAETRLGAGMGGRTRHPAAGPGGP